MNTEEKSRYFTELTVTSALPWIMAGSGTGKDVAGDIRSAALNKVIDIARITAEYMSHLEAAPHLTASGLDGDYRLPGNFNGVVLAGHPTQYGAQFVTWERSPDQASLGMATTMAPMPPWTATLPLIRILLCDPVLSPTVPFLPGAVDGNLP